MASHAHILQTLKGHNSDVVGCDFFGHYLATCSGDKLIKVWIQGGNGQFSEVSFSPLTGHTYGVNCVRFSPFGTLLASCSTDGRIILWSIQTATKLCELQHSSGSSIRVCSFSHTSAILASGGDDEKVVLWDITTKSVLRVLEGHEAMITAIAFTPDSAFLTSCSTAGDIILWDARYGHGKPLSVVDAHDLGVLGCDFSSQYEATSENGFLSGNYTLATCGNDDFVKLWLVKTGAIKTFSHIVTLEGHSGNVMSCRFSVDGKMLASTAGDRCVILWNPNTGQPLKKLEGHNRYVTCCAFSSTTLLATGSNDKSVVIWSLDREKLLDSVIDLQVPNSENSYKPEQNISCWSVEDVANWLDSLQLSDYSEIFKSHAIDGKELMYLNHENLLTSMKVEILGHRNKILRSIHSLKNPLWHHVLSEADDTAFLQEFYCPITQEVMLNPVVAADGYSYERAAIEEWLASGKETSPMTNQYLEHKVLIPNFVLHQLIQKFKE